MPTVLLKFILDNWLANEMYSTQNYTFFGISTALFLFYSVVSTYSLFLARKIGICVTKSMNGVIMNKVFKLSHKSLSECAHGKLLALISQDSDFITEQFGGILHRSTGIFGMIVSTAILLYFIGWVALTGLVFMVLTLLLEKVFRAIRLPVLKQESKNGDALIKLITDMISGVRTIKTYAWERIFLMRVAECRKK